MSCLQCISTKHPAIGAGLLVAWLAAQAALAAPPPGDADGNGAPGATAVAADAPAPDLGLALKAAVDETRARVRVLSAHARATDDPERVAELNREVAAARRQLQRRLLEIQLEFAERRGDADLAGELVGILARLDRPAVGVPQPRPLPQPAPSAH